MAGSYYLYNGDGSQKIFTTPPYLSKSHVKVYIDDVEYSDFSWLNDSQIELATAPQLGSRIIVKRETPKTRLMNYTPNSILKSAVMNRDSIQIYYIMEEVVDDTGEALSLDIISGQWDAGTLRIQQVGNPVDSTDAATKSYVDNEVASVIAGNFDHGALSGLGDDDHPQYFNTARGDARYMRSNHINIYDHTKLHPHTNKTLLDRIPNHPSADRFLKAKADGTVVWEDAASCTIPTGAIMAFASVTQPNGWLKCNGAAVSRTTYAALFAAIGTTFGAGDGSTTFKLPDLRGEFVRGWDDGRGVDSGRTIGSAQGHAVQDHSHLSNVNCLNTVGYASNNNLFMGTGGNYGTFNTGTMASGNIAAETRPRNVALMYCIKY